MSMYNYSMAVQKMLDGAPGSIDSRRELASAQLEGVNENWSARPNRVARAFCAWYIDDQLTAESHLSPNQKFGEVILKGSVPRVSCIEVAERLVVSLPFFNAVVLGPTTEIESVLVDMEMNAGDFDTVLSVNERLQRPLYVPVEDLAFIAFAA